MVPDIDVPDFEGEMRVYRLDGWDAKYRNEFSQPASLQSMQLRNSMAPKVI